MTRGFKLKVMNYYLKVLQNYATFNGRARRKEDWMFFLFNVIGSFIISFIGGIIGIHVGNLYLWVVLIPSIAVGFRRMHDVGKSGWFLLIPIYNFILAVTEGNTGDNEYGADPTGDSSNDSLLEKSHISSSNKSSTSVKMENNNLKVLANRKFQHKQFLGATTQWIFNEDGSKVNLKGGMFGFFWINTNYEIESLGEGKFVGKGLISQKFSLEGNRIKSGPVYLNEIFN